MLRKIVQPHLPDFVIAEQINQAHINYALVEDTRPPMYTAMKYWGKKPHNIWSQFIERYCPPGGITLDPFAGSAVAAFEAVKINRKAIAFDLNPLTSFIVEVLTSTFDESAFLQAYDQIAKVIENDPVYIEHFTKDYRGQKGIVFNYRWFSNEVVKVALEIPSTKKKKGKTKKGTRYLLTADSTDKTNAEEMQGLDIPYWYPSDGFPDTPSITHKFISDVGGNGFQHLWTRRNLYLLSKIFDEILKQEDPGIRLQLLFGFIQTLHLTSKMVVPRDESAQRDFSGSWGRADYMIRRKQMEQNPLIVFRRSCIEKQGVISALQDASDSLPANLKVADFNKTRRLRLTADINYGILDVADLSSYIQDKSVDFIITDPPYAGLVQYLDLSLVWLVWLQKVNKKYLPDLNSEITIKKGQIEREEYRRRLQHAFKQLHRVLKDDGYIVFTFHHKKLEEWNEFVQAVRLAGFKFDRITHQYNKRSGESNVANPYGTSGADFYIRCVKRREVDFSNDISGLHHFILQKTIEIIASRNEPTPYEFIIAGLLPEMLQAGYFQPKEYQDEIFKILNKHVGADKIFIVTKNTENKAGDYWWFANPSQYINYPDMPLSSRVEETVLAILRRRVSVRFDDVLSELFRNYPNGVTPDPRGITAILQKYAYKSASKWKIKETTLKNSTEHTEVIRRIANIGKRANSLVYIGKREQPEFYEGGGRLRDLADIQKLEAAGLSYDTKRIERIEMVDVVWLSKNRQAIKCIFEVENSTDFTSAILRGSNIEKEVPKFMAIPARRESELRNMRDPMFLEIFKDNNWQYTTYESINRLTSYSKPSVEEILKVSKSL
ncbi:MAG TPA: DNA methyltransferase [Pyrinomonadaceae bacterium]|nr:DNA methyltransferase [Pyrinomonadaceae bacterium]